MTFSRDAKDQERLIDYVRQALARIDAGSVVDPVELCREHPHLARPLAEVLGLAADLPALQQQALREDPLAGLVLASRYRLDGCRGRGAMGVVYSGEDQELRRPVAVKILDARLFRDPQAEQRFRREGEALAALQHPHIVAVHDRGRTPEGIHFLVMELLEGCTLAALLERITAGAAPIAAVTELGTVPTEKHWPRLAARWAADLARGLAAAHAHGLVHRDVKPSNVFVRTDGRPMLLDFGIAARAADERLTATQTTLGTPWYMAPEQVHAGGAMTAEPTLDVYGLGATLYHLLAGRPPYQGDASSVLAQLQTSDPAPLAVVAPDVPRDLRAIVEHALERDVLRRYPTANAFADDLEAFLEHRPVVARPLSAFGRRLRTWRRAPAKPVAVAAVALTLAVAAIAMPIHRQQLREADQRAINELYATLPSVLAVEGRPDERGLAELRGEHETAISLLDRILALDAADIPVRLWRACLRYDLDDRTGAAEDLLVIAADSTSPYLQGLAARYASASMAQLRNLKIDTSGLPEPVTAVECYVAGLHELRARDVKGFASRADALLERASATYMPARDLRLLSVAALTELTTGAEQQRLLDFLYDESLKLETHYGGKTARTLAMRGVALLLMRRYPEAVDAFLESLQLRPKRHGPHQNLGIAYLRLGQFDKSEQHLDQALGCRSFAWNTKHTLAQLERMRGNYTAAYAWAEQLATEGHNNEAWRQPSMVGSIAVDEAVSLRRADVEKSRAAARSAVEAYDRALLANPNSDALKRRRQLAVALQADDLGAAMVEYAKVLLEGDLDDPYELSNLAFLVPDTGLDPAETAWLVAVLRKIAAARAAGNEALRTRLLRDTEERLKTYR